MANGVAGMRRGCCRRNFPPISGVILTTPFHDAYFFAHACRRAPLSAGVTVKILLWIIAIIFLIGLLVVSGVLKLIF
jgi:hypothetical protein